MNDPYSNEPQNTYTLSPEDQERIQRYEEQKKAEEQKQQFAENQKEQLRLDAEREAAYDQKVAQEDFTSRQAEAASREPTPRATMPYQGSFPGEGEVPEESDSMKDYVLSESSGRENLVLGAGDFIADAASLLPWLKPAGDWWDEKTGRKEASGVDKFVRDTAGTVVPLMFGYGVMSKGFQGMAKLDTATRAGKAGDIIGKTLLNLGIGTGVNVISETTEEAGNLSSLVEDFSGMGMPLSTYDTDSPDDIKTKNVIEGVITDASFGAAELIGPGIKALKLKLGSGKGNMVTVDGVPQPKPTPAQEVAIKVDAKSEAVDIEAIERFRKDPKGEKGRDAFVNEPAEAQERFMPNTDANPANFLVDNDRIQNNIGSTDGRARPAHTEHFKDAFLKADTSEEVEEIINQASGDLQVNVENMIGGVRRSTEDIQRSIDAMTAKVFRDTPEVLEADVANLMTQGEKIWGNDVSTLSKDAQMELENAITTALEIMAPEKRNARAALSVQAGGTIVDTSRAIKLIGDDYNTARHQEVAIKNLGVLLKATRQARYIDGYRLQMNNLIKQARINGEKINAQWFNERNEAFQLEVQNRGQKTLEFIDLMVDISSKNPEYFKPMFQQFVKTNGDIDTMEKLGKLVEKRLGFWRKAFVDGDPEVPSLLIKEMDAVRYNNVLNGLAPVRAATGAGIGLIGKPLTQLAGYAANLDMKGFGDTIKVFGGVVENFQRGLQYAAEEWRYAVQNPDFALQRGRKDFALSDMNDFDTLEQLSESWYKDKQWGKVAAWNMLKTVSFFNRQSWNRWGINSMQAIDGFVKSMNASMISRQRAMKEVFDETNGAWDEALFNKKQKELYSKSFDSNGILTNEAAKYASGEINLNLDTNMVSGIEGFIKQVPIARSLFLFPRTGVNAVELVSTFNPGGALGLAVGKARKTLKAKIDTPEAVEVLMEHGFEPDDMEALTRLKAEYKGRYMMGSAVTMGAGIMAIQGNLTGSGPANEAMKRDMLAMGWQPYSIKINGEWRSYQGLEPFDTYLGLVADMVFEGQRLDQAITEDWFRTLAHAVTQNVANKTFLSGFKPLADLTSLQNEGAWQRFVANTGDSYIPGTGVRSILSKAIVPQLKDLQYNWQSYMANRNRWLPPVNSNLVDSLDIYTGEKIKYHDPLTAAINAILPFGKTNGGMEPWRQELLKSGWTGMPRWRINSQTGEPFTPEQRQYMTNWIARNTPLGEKVEDLFSKPDKWWRKELQRFAKERGLKPKNLMDIKRTALHEYLTKIHNEAYSQAEAALRESNESVAMQAKLKAGADMAVSQGNFEQAADIAEQFINQSLK